MRDPGALILLRHGESTANAAGLFTGVLDVPLTAAGLIEAHAAAELLRRARLMPSIVFTSVLQRAVCTTRIVLTDLKLSDDIVRSDWRLIERNYGALTGRSKTEVLDEYGARRFLSWRRSVDTAPPPMPDDLFRAVCSAARLHRLPAEAVTRGESLREVIGRVRGFYEECVLPQLAAGHTVLLVSHGNALRALCAVIDELTDSDVQALNLPTGQPLIYRLDEGMRPLHRGGRYLDEVGASAAAVVLANEGGT